MKREEFIDKINSSNCYCLALIDDLFDEKIKLVAKGLDLDTHRWYSKATNVYELQDGYAGVNGAFISNSEGQTWEDIGVKCNAFPMKQIKTVTYIKE